MIFKTTFNRRFVGIIAIATCLTLLLSISGQSQSYSGNLILRVFPSDAIVKIDGKKYDTSKNGGYVQLNNMDTGQHQLQCWAPTLELIERSFTIHADSTLKINQYIPYSAEFKEFQKQRRLQLLGKSALIVLPTVLLATTTTTFLVDNRKRKDDLEIQRTAIEDLKRGYDNAISYNEIDSYENQYNEAMKRYDESVEDYNRFVLNSSLQIGGSAIIAGLSYYWVSRFKKLEYQEETLLSRSSLSLDPINSQVSLTFKF